MFLAFESDDERAKFLENVQRDRPDLVSKLYSAKFQPTIVCQGLTEEESRWLEERMRGRGKIHPDVKFSPMRP
jgi:hypothetical protein